MAESEQITYHVTTSRTEFQNRSQIFVLGTRNAFSEVSQKRKDITTKCIKQKLLIAVTWSQFWLWKLKSSIFVCLFVYLFDCTSRFANFVRGKWSNHDSKNYSEIRTVTWSVIWLWKLQFTTLIFFIIIDYHHFEAETQGF